MRNFDEQPWGISTSGGNVIDDGLSDEEIAARTLAWIEELRSKPPVRTPETAAEALDHLYAYGDL
ncbi:MAG: hypothetical protein IT195_10100 [Microthrixaceae bacterium]|nr:hypothetical protein [Microthrixaceae bacterium]